MSTTRHRKPLARFLAPVAICAGIALGVLGAAGTASASSAKPPVVVTVSPSGASLNGASLNGASLNGASFNGASPNGASLN